MLANIAINLNNMRKNTNNTRGAFTDIIGGVAKTMSDISAIIQYYKAKLNILLKQKMAFISIVAMFAKAIGVTLWVLINGPLPQMIAFLKDWWIVFIIIMVICIICLMFLPLGLLPGPQWWFCPICLLCFSPNTLIKMKNNTLQPIYKLKIGDKIKKGGTVISTIKIYIKNRTLQMYNYNNTIVTGSHIVYENNQPIRVSDSKLAKKVDYKEDYIYCINTSRHMMIDNFNNIFSDFHECDNAKYNFRSNYEMIKALNHNLPFNYSPNNILHLYQWGLSYNTPIKMNNNKYKSLDCIKIGDTLYNNNKVYGIVLHYNKDIIPYQYNNIILSGSQIIYEDNEWKRCNQSNKFKINNNKPDYYISLFTHNHTFHTKYDIIVRDYIEIDENHRVFDTIHNLNLTSI